MTAQALIVLACVLWLLMCLRFWTMIDRRNQWQRHVIAVAAGLGAAMIYILGTMVWKLLQLPPTSEAPPAAVEQAEDIKVTPKPPADAKPPP
jgi:hypothetical protein